MDRQRAVGTVAGVRRALERRLIGARRVYVVDLLWRAGHAFQLGQGTLYAAAISYYAVFSLFPLLIFLVDIFGLVVRDPAVQLRVTDMIAAQIPAQLNLRQQVERTVVEVANANSGLVGVVAIAGLAWTASAMFSALRRGLNAAFGVAVARSYLHGRLIDLASVLTVSLLILLSTAMTAALGVLRALSASYLHGLLVNPLWEAVFLALPVATSFVVFLFLYRMVPTMTLRSRDLWIGALIAAVGFELAKLGFGLYLSTFGGYRAVYGALGGAVLFFLFIFLTANIVIFAATVSAELARDRARVSSAAG
ncbi:MAG TPA: YihY/virulence factor BrkB family protein [Thermomicrobiaceae bacterium]|nr:YihY/virulence factor BrkB family protein [Thermomicrobiaceae bacterium]